MYDLVIEFLCTIVTLLPVFFGVRVLFDYLRIFLFNDR